MNQIKDVLIKNKKYIIIFILLIILIDITSDIFSDEIVYFDNIFYNLLVKDLRFKNIHTFMIIITTFGSAPILIGISLLSIILIKNKKIGISICSNLLFITLLNVIFKNIIQRDRPIYKLIVESGYSFPSGHAMISMAFYGFIIFLIFRYIKNRKILVIFSIILSMLILFIGISRVYLGVHYASDVVAGYIISLVYLILYTSIIFKVNDYIKLKKKL